MTCWTKEQLENMLEDVVKEHREPREFWIEADRGGRWRWVHQQMPEVMNGENTLIHVREVLE